MAIYIQNNLLSGGDYVRYTKNYSTPQSLHRARKKGFVEAYPTGQRTSLTYTAPHTVAEVYGLSTWQGLPVAPAGKLPGGLISTKNIGKKVGVAEVTILGWAVLNKIDVYWVAGHFLASLQHVKQIAASEAARMKALPLVTKPKRARQRY